MMKADEIRSRFLKYFEGQGHTRVLSASLIPRDDPTLLFTNAGMVQFKRLFTGEEKRDYLRAVTAQKCVRAGGKHNDLENVGYTARHHTFFEMLGNFSFGDYFKAEAIEFAWELLTKGFELPADRLYATVYEEDDEAAALWPKISGLPDGRVIRLGEKDNFWAMGDTGPCGPCSEILIDQGPEYGCGRPGCAPGCDCDRYLEIWNLVFMQFERAQSGRLMPLPRPSIDTGMGLERLAAVVQKVPSNFETDLFRPLIDYIGQLSGHSYLYGKIPNPQEPGFRGNVSTRVIADHARAAAFLIGDGVRPENIGRGYVLRRILRRAVRHGLQLGLNRPFLAEVAGQVARLMSGAYPEMKDNAAYIRQTIRQEEDRFRETLTQGMSLLTEELERLAGTENRTIDGRVAFKLYDTYGFPLDLVEDVGREHGLTVDKGGFETAMAAQKAASRASWKGGGAQDDRNLALINELTARGFKSVFTGYDSLEEDGAELALIIKDGQKTDCAQAGDEVGLVFYKTPLYATSGGQEEDEGEAFFPAGRADIFSVRKTSGAEATIHWAKVTAGVIKVGEPARLLVAEQRRRNTARNHTATHILHKALREILGPQVRQAGSLVSSERLRFDFTHPEALSRGQLEETERLANHIIGRNLPVTTEVMNMQEAVQSGAVALFEERYGATVRVVSIGEASKELCGGTHARSSGELGALLILSEGSVASGVRRLEAVTGPAAIDFMQAERRRLWALGDLLKAAPDELADRVQKLQARVKELEKARLKSGGDVSIDSLLARAEVLNGLQTLLAKVEAEDPKALRALGDRLRDKNPQLYLVLGAVSPEGKAMLLAMAPPEAARKYPAGILIKQIAAEVGGQGGGRPDMAQAGGPDAAKLPGALEKAKAILAAGG